MSFIECYICIFFFASEQDVQRSSFFCLRCQYLCLKYSIGIYCREKDRGRIFAIYFFALYSRVCNEPNASLLALGDCARVKYPAPWGELAKREAMSCPVALLWGI